MKDILKKPIAWLPLVMSLVALAFLLSYIATFGVVYHEDEGAPARLFQMLMFAQAVIIIFFAMKYLPQEPKRAATVLAMQLAAASVPIAILLILEA